MTRHEYWRKQIRRILVLLAVWAVVGFGMAIFLAPTLNKIDFGGIPFGFWVAQQGSIFVFVVLVFLYAWLSDKADRAAGLAETDDTISGPGASH